jgi:hypothetical protein
MKRSIIAILAIVMLTGCSPKVVTWDSMGEKTVTTRTNEDLYHEAQAKAWAGYFEALKNPPVIATIQQPDGSVLTINSQVPPPAPVIRQHQNQYIKPVTDVIKWGIGGIVVDRGLRAIVKGTGDIITENSGDGTVYVDKSDSIASKTDASFSTDTDHSQTNPDPVVVDPVIVEQPEYNDPVIVQPEIVRPEIVDPVIVNQTEQ